MEIFLLVTVPEGLSIFPNSVLRDLLEADSTLQRLHTIPPLFELYDDVQLSLSNLLGPNKLCPFFP